MVVRYHWICGCNHRAMLKTVRFDFFAKKRQVTYHYLEFMGKCEETLMLFKPSQWEQHPVLLTKVQSHGHWHRHGLGLWWNMLMGRWVLKSPGSTWLFKQKFLTLLKSGRARADEIEGELKWSLEGEQPTLQELGRPCYYRRLLSYCITLKLH